LPGDLPDLGIELRSPVLQADALPSRPPAKPTQMCEYIIICRKCYAVYLEEFNLKKKKKKGLPRSELGLDFRPLGLLWT